MGENWGEAVVFVEAGEGSRSHLELVSIDSPPDEDGRKTNLKRFI